MSFNANWQTSLTAPHLEGIKKNLQPNPNFLLSAAVKVRDAIIMKYQWPLAFMKSCLFSII